ncbi:hypothetical protein COX64_03410 [Candidatus Dojkabacteria bacterium CG_4_10_14_0_2_um_filter_Dojkabacteria_WS6_41_15]|uniref:Transcription regulator TrmB N-terminal domain-containing protein n=1 Tax=Candidatus Dojkabacteria bacterium CG_4_10_14_0_2_um_filter_Dojkabacteria_WS6_41_15 TaxID=2014249 RepID=A0A2M7W1G5_9BACT|nr:MAG: hypothetical protein COX64_03410 [Candidatus Dojkabacteria bacterium CG_4_10_14_0_2_um_filter_Dojkabacteria_WS6_41_15]
MSELLTTSMNTTQYLTKLGLNSAHTAIYIALAERGEQTVLQLSRVLSIPRSSLYLELESMQSQGLVTAKKEAKSTRYKAISVLSIKNILQEKQQSLKELFEGFDDFTHNIKEEKGEFGQKYEVTVYKGREGIKQLLWNILTSDAKEVVGFSPGTLEHVVDREFAEEWRAEFKARGKHNKIIVNKAVPLTWSGVPDFLTKKYVEVRTLEEKKITFSHEVWFYGKTLVVISTKDDPEQYGIEITDRLLVSSYRQLFDLVWNEVAKKVE